MVLLQLLLLNFENISSYNANIPKLYNRIWLEGRFGSCDYISVRNYRDSSQLARNTANQINVVGSNSIDTSVFYVASTFESTSMSIQSKEDYKDNTIHHRTVMEDLLYPKHIVTSKTSISMKQRQHAVRLHPIYNFLHTYYRYSPEILMNYSPGIGIIVNGINLNNIPDLIRPYFIEVNHGVTISVNLLASDHKKRTKLYDNYQLMLQTSLRQPHFGCFGYHEWAMLYSGSSPGSVPLAKHQPHLEWRVNQSVIDEIVSSNNLKCTHFDAWRFFHPDAKSLNSIPVMSRSSQIDHDQPGCIHVAMDLFKYAYSLYPFISSDSLRSCLEIAIEARLIDMRASPYDVSGYDVCKQPIPVETMEGKREYIAAQEDLYKKSQQVRLDLLRGYQNVVESIERI